MSWLMVLLAYLPSSPTFLIPLTADICKSYDGFLLLFIKPMLSCTSASPSSELSLSSSFLWIEEFLRRCAGITSLYEAIPPSWLSLITMGSGWVLSPSRQ